MGYLLDTNVFIQAKNLYYGFDICPAFWQWLDAKSVEGAVFSINEVRDEMIGRTDELAEWVRGRGDGLFLKQDAAVASSLALIANWVQAHPNYTPAAKFEFLQEADYPLIAYAHAHKHIVVTHERPEESKKSVKIPNVCLAMNVEYTTPFTMLRRERARFVLAQPEP